MSSIRFVQNVNLQVLFNGEPNMVPFSTGEIYDVIRIEKEKGCTENAYAYNDIYMPDGSVIKGVAGEVFENMGGRVPVEFVEVIEDVPENKEIEVIEEEVEVALLDGTMRSND